MQEGRVLDRVAVKPTDHCYSWERSKREATAANEERTGRR